MIGEQRKSFNLRVHIIQCNPFKSSTQVAFTWTGNSSRLGTQIGARVKLNQASLASSSNQTHLASSPLLLSAVIILIGANRI